MKAFSCFLAVIATSMLSGCFAAAQTAPAQGAALEAAAPAAPRLDLLSKAIEDFTDAAARAKKAAAAAKNPSIAKLATDRAACYDIMLAHLTARSTSGAADAPVKGVFSLKEKVLEVNDQLQAQSGASLVPLDVQANCASLAAQEAGAVANLFKRFIALAGLMGNPLLAPAAAGVGAALIKAQP